MERGGRTNTLPHRQRTALFTSGCRASAFFLYARLISAGEAPRGTPRTVYGSRGKGDRAEEATADGGRGAHRRGRGVGAAGSGGRGRAGRRAGIVPDAPGLHERTRAQLSAGVWLRVPAGEKVKERNGWWTVRSLAASLVFILPICLGRPPFSVATEPHTLTIPMLSARLTSPASTSASRGSACGVVALAAPRGAGVPALSPAAARLSSAVARINAAPARTLAIAGQLNGGGEMSHAPGVCGGWMGRRRGAARCVCLTTKCRRRSSARRRLATPRPLSRPPGACTGRMLAPSGIAHASAACSPAH